MKIADWKREPKFDKDNFEKCFELTGYKYVYEMLAGLLPVKSFEIRSIDIDTAEDYEKAVEWTRNNYSNSMLFGG